MFLLLTRPSLVMEYEQIYDADNEYTSPPQEINIQEVRPVTDNCKPANMQQVYCKARSPFCFYRAQVVTTAMF